MPPRKPDSYQKAIRSFDHSPVARLPSYAEFRRALDQLAAEAGAQEVKIAEFLAAVYDSASTTPFPDNCEKCATGLPSWPHSVNVEANGGWMTASYVCPAGHRWTCGWSTSTELGV